jgi:hypothetical protein
MATDFFSLYEFYKSIDRQVEEQWSKAKCKWFFGKLRKERLREKILWSNLTVTTFGPITINIIADDEC